MEDGWQEALRPLRPQKPQMIMDLAEAAGIDVTPWKVKRDGTSVGNPRANPTYCYEWAFGGDGEPTLLCVWHASLTVSDGFIKFEDNLRQFALKLDRVAIERSNPPHVKSRARDQARRARRFDSKVQRAYRKGDPVRVVLLVGDERSEEELGWDTSKVRYRSLDPEVWYVHSYSDDTGAFRMVRGVSPEKTSVAKELNKSSHFADQFSLPDLPDRRLTGGSAFARSQEVRQAALDRASGTCEVCEERGFITDAGAVFLETHHVIPLAEGGPDVEWNVVAICPNDHRRAHFSKDRAEMRSRLVEHLIELYPAAESALRTLLIGDPTGRTLQS